MEKKTAQYYSEVSRTMDEGLRRYVLSVFSYMSIGLFLTAIVAGLVASSPTLCSIIFFSRLTFFVIAFAPLGIAVYLGAKINDISAKNARTLFFVYSGLLGLSLSSLVLIYTTASLVYTFFVASSMFLSMALYGYATQKDLTGWGSFLFMGLIGIIIAGLVNIFLQHQIFDFVISAIGVIVFAGLTAYDMQNIKGIYMDSDSAEVGSKKAVIGALNLYLDFINLFLHLLRFLGSRRN
ncbi:MAG: Bax inhibitor-1/YccA family protein [Holosporaceae bacterium]|jgi:FtsH-binding integral membrane protein|nr:Bax inhibitor-1/YccA family protein [Holosporaceae bacterium]